MDLPDALAKFEVPGLIDSPGALNDAISNVLEALDTTEADIVSLLTTLTYATYGMLEVVLTSRSDTAFIFRSRIIKALQKSSTTPHTIFIMCAERLRAMLVGLPPDEIVLDRTVMETWSAFTASKKHNLSEQLRECFETFFGACTEEAIEDWAHKNLLNSLKSTNTNSQPSFPFISKARAPYSPLMEKAFIESPIKRVAVFVVGLFNQSFPHSIDSLTPEVSLGGVSAHKPVFFSGREDGSDFRRLISDSKSGKVELGAHQVIIVRDEAAAKKLQTEIGRVALVLTLYESRGMEFDDVLLYDFFTDSAATATDWRAVLLSHHDGRTFDERKHSILQIELKSFYVGLTRARERVWIWDSSTKGQDVEALLVTSLLATAYEANQKVPQLGASSSREEWAKRAQQYFSKEVFGGASFCFKKAGIDWWARVALAYGDRQVASRLPDKHPRRLAALDEVGRIFDRLGPQAEASDDPENARLMFINAAECFASIPNHSAAAQAFFKSHKYTEAAYHYRMAGMFDEAVDVVNTWEVDPAVAASIEYAAKFVYARKGDVKSLHKAWRICESKEEFVEFLEENGFEEQRTEFLVSITEHEESGDVFWKAGNFLDAIARYRRSKKPSAIIKSVECLLDGLRSNITLGSQIGKAEPILTKLLSLSQQLSLNADQKAEVSLFQAIVSSRVSDLLKLGRSFFEQAESRCALLALDTWIHAESLEDLEVDVIAQVMDILLGCQNYCYVINVLVQRPELLKEPAIQQLLGISSAIEQGAGERGTVADYAVRPQSFIFSEAAARKDPLLKGDTSTPVVLPKDAVNDMVLRALLRRRNDVLMRVHRHALKSGAFEICSKFLATGRCADVGGWRCWRGHIPSNAMTIELFNSRFRLYLLIIAVLDQFAAVDGFDADERNRPNMQRIWLSRIFDLCYPEDPRAGNLCDVIPTLLPDYGTLMPILKSWLQEVYLRLRPAVQSRFFLSNILRISLLATWIDYDKAKAYLPTGLWFSDEQVASRDELLQDNGRPIVGAALTWFARNTGARHNLGVYTIKHIVEHKVAVDVDVAASYIEEVCGQLILNHYMHDLSCSYDNMIMPRSWIIRALMRQSSYLPNGSMPHILVSILGTFIEKLVGKRDAGQLQHRGQALPQSGPPIAAIVRICRCLALLGVNNQKLKKVVLLSLQALKSLTEVQRTEFVRFSTAVEWTHVEEALQVSMVSSSLDDLVKVIMPPRQMVPNPSGPRYVFCSDDTDLLSKLLIGTHIPLAAPLLLLKEPRAPNKEAPAPTGPTKGDEDPSANRSSEATRTQTAGTVILRLFLRSRHRAGGPVAAAFEDLVKRLIGGQKQPSRLLMLCLRGPLPHVLNSLHVLEDASLSKVASLDMAMLACKHEELDELHFQGVEIRRIRNLANELVKDLQPTSEFYVKSSTTASTLDEIIKKVNLIPDLVKDVRKFTSFPEDLDYELGVEAILSDRAPWAPKKPTAKKERRPALSAQDLDGYDDY